MIESVVIPAGVGVRQEVRPEWKSVLSDEALGFVAMLHNEFNPRRIELLSAREDRKARLDAGELPGFLTDTREIRDSDWTVAPIPRDLLDRRVEITGPVDRKMIINALNSGANVFMADFEDANSPTWENCIQGQLNLFDAVRGTIAFESGVKKYQLNEQTATLLVRPRGWHLDEKHVTIDGEPVSASLFDFALYFFHNAQELVARGSGPYFYLPKLESHLEARLWNDVFLRAQQELNIPAGTVRATVLIETILAAFEMHEILYELREHSAGLNCGRWDYIFSFVKKFRARRDFITPDRGSITMDKAFLAAYVDLLIQTCHRRGIHAMGGMAAQIPIKGDDAANGAAFAKVRADKLREVTAGHDGTWVAHPGMVALAKEVFDQHMKGPNQLAARSSQLSGEEARESALRTPAVDSAPASCELRAESSSLDSAPASCELRAASSSTLRAESSSELLALPEGVVTEAGVRQNINVGILYLAAWLGGSGAVPLYNLMEDAATAEISRTQLWQWVHHGATLDDGRIVDAELYRRIRDEELARIGDPPHAKTAATIFDDLILATELADFLTIPAYEELLKGEQS